ncbi:hypothetical protein X759_17825 [Mesorhizobium sp. LSHC420B00]|nr:hypothetical protein X759_17825 [Mesorhizobium sp. LSHC420B00]
MSPEAADVAVNTAGIGDLLIGFSSGYWMHRPTKGSRPIRRPASIRIKRRQKLFYRFRHAGVSIL